MGDFFDIASRAAIREFDYDDIATVVQHLTKAAFEYDKYETVRMMKLIVPEFISNNSEYEMVDKELEQTKMTANN